MKIPLSKSGEPLTELSVLGPGVVGYAIEENGAIYIPMIEAMLGGSGDVGRFIDNLPADQMFKFANVISVRLQGMLLRRGYVRTIEHDALTDCDVDVWVKVK